MVDLLAHSVSLSHLGHEIEVLKVSTSASAEAPGTQGSNVNTVRGKSRRTHSSHTTSPEVRRLCDVHAIPEEATSLEEQA